MPEAKEELRPLNPAAMELEAPAGGLRAFPAVERWDDWVEYDPAAWPRKVEKHYTLVPTICFNCEAGCGLLAYVDKGDFTIRKFEGNPAHPGSRGRNCAKGPATINQVTDPERILYPLRRAGRRGEGKWERVTWDEVLDDLAGRIRSALIEGRRNEMIYHVGRPGHELIYNQRILHAWGIDGHNSHTNVCSAGARTGYAFWHGADRPSPDHANARFILLLSSHLEAGHYFNPHAQRIIEGKQRGARSLRDRHAALQHRDQGRLLALDLAGQRGGGAAGDVPRDPARAAVRSRVRAPLGQLGRVSARGASRARANFRHVSGSAWRSLCRIHARVRRARVGRVGRGHRRSRARDRPRRFGARDPRLAQRGGGQSGRMAGGARAGVAGGA